MKPSLYNVVEKARAFTKTAPESAARTHIAALLEVIYAMKGNAAEDAHFLAEARAQIDAMHAAEQRRLAGWDGTGSPVEEREHGSG